MKKLILKARPFIMLFKNLKVQMAGAYSFAGVVLYLSEADCEEFVEFGVEGVVKHGN